MTQKLTRGFIDRLLPAPVGGGFHMEGYWVWCASVIQGEDGLHHMFASRWPKGLPMFEGYVLSSEIVRAVSEKPEGPYRFAEKILPSNSPDNWDGRMAHNPTIHRHGGRYYLFYIGSTYTGALPASLTSGAQSPQIAECYSNIKIGMVSADSPLGPWTRCDKPILYPRPGQWDGTVVTNPAPCLLPGGKVHLYYRSNTPEGLRIGLAVADSPDGVYSRVQDDPVMLGIDVEDPFVWHNGAQFEMLAKDMSGDLTGERHAGAHMSSTDGISWTLEGKGYSRNMLWSDGRRVEQGCLERPQLLFNGDGEPSFLFAAVADGPGGFRNAAHTWNAAIPLASFA